MRQTIYLVFAQVLLIGGCASGPRPAVEEKKVTQPKAETTADVEADLGKFIAAHVVLVAPLQKQMNLAFWDASVTGTKDAYKKNAELELAIRKLYSNRENFAYLKKVRAAGKVKDVLLARQLEILFLDFQENQIDPGLMEKTVKLSNEVQETFNTYRGVVDGHKVTDNKIYDILKSSSDSKKRQVAWEAYKKRGALVSAKVVELAKLRNQAARSLGYDNFYNMRLKLIEQDPAAIKKIFDDLAARTDEPFKKLMQRVNAALAKRYGIKPEELMPWHYEDPFFQEGPAIGKVDLDRFFKGTNQKALVTSYYQGIGLDPADILARSDLFAKPDKMPHAFCTDIDRQGDVRILANLNPTEMQTSTLLHETGHGVFSKYIDRKLPWLLRSESHEFTTEAIAMLFGRLTRNPGWLLAMLKVPADQIKPLVEDIHFQQRLGMLVMARWTMVVVNFERGLYADPDQDLNKLWWDLKKRYQLLTPPERPQGAADWASKIHIAAWPVYYHNYMLGEMMASQLHYYLAREILKIAPQDMDYVGLPEIGKFLTEKIFAPGKSLRWDQFLNKATGETLNPKYFVEQFVK
ncbi:MAG TPA: M2 family metallopeptidase [Myxococcota bacterium]|nr:M2 family metallopeptidase [Myxococcota bacterium]